MEDRFEIAPEALFRAEGERLFVLDRRSGDYLEVSGAGVRIWELARTGHSRAQIEDALEREFDAPRERLVDDAGRFLARLVELRLLRSIPG